MLFAAQSTLLAPAEDFLDGVKRAMGRRELVVEQVPRDFDRDPDWLAQYDQKERQHGDMEEREDRPTQPDIADHVSKRTNNGPAKSANRIVPTPAILNRNHQCAAGLRDPRKLPERCPCVRRDHDDAI